MSYAFGVFTGQDSLSALALVWYCVMELKHTKLS